MDGGYARIGSDFPCHSCNLEGLVCVSGVPGQADIPPKVPRGISLVAVDGVCGRSSKLNRRDKSSRYPLGVSQNTHNPMSIARDIEFTRAAT